MYMNIRFGSMFKLRHETSNQIKNLCDLNPETEWNNCRFLIKIYNKLIFDNKLIAQTIISLNEVLILIYGAFSQILTLILCLIVIKKFLIANSIMDNFYYDISLLYHTFHYYI